jgi:hypothetical protein
MQRLTIVLSCSLAAASARAQDADQLARQLHYAIASQTFMFRKRWRRRPLQSLRR